VERSEVRIQTGDGELAAWVYRPDTPDETAVPPSWSRLKGRAARAAAA
jgi:hypothetical protein